MPFKFTVNKNPLSIEFETESIVEGLTILLDGKNELARAFDEFSGNVGDTDAPAATDGKQTRTRRTKAQIVADKAREEAEATQPAAPAPVTAPPAPPTATAPAPLPVPGVATAGDDNMKIPTFLDRNATAAPAAQAAQATPPATPVPPVATAPTPPAPPAAPVRTLADKVVENLKKRAATAPDGGKSLAEWCANAGLVTTGATFEETLAVVQFCSDAQLGPAAKALQVE